jgi:hypothetical protein
MQWHLDNIVGIIQDDSEISLEKNLVIGDDEEVIDKKKFLIKVFPFSRYK